MKNKFLPLMMLLCFAWFGGARAEEVIVGEATTTSSYLPTYCYYNYSLSQQIYTANEIGTTGTISSVSFWCTTPGVERSLDIYLVNTDKTAFSGSTDWIAVTSADKVFSGTVSFLANQWNAILLNTPFEYDGTHNLALIVDDNTGSYVNTYPSFNVYESTSQALRIYSDGTNYNPMAPSSYSGTVMNMKNQIKLNFPTCLPFTNVHIVEGSLTYNGVTIMYDYNAGDLQQYFMTTSAYFDPENINWSYQWQSEPLIWDNLIPDTDYTFGVRKYCSEDDQSEPVIMTLHTPPACPPVSNLNAYPINAWQVSLGWNGPESGSDTRAEYKLSAATEWTLWGDHMGDGGVLVCQPNSTYDFRVLQYCTNGFTSDWEQISFTMPPEPLTIPFSESFDATSIPDRWAKYTGLLDDVMNGTTLQTATGGWNFGTSNGAFDGNSHARLNIYGTSCRYWLVTPQVAMENNCQLSFELALTKYSGTLQPVDPTKQADDRFVVLASTNNGMTWTILREWNNTGSPYVYNNILPTGEDVVIDLTAYQDANLMIAFYGESTNPTGMNNTGGDNNLHIDNVSIDYIPPCALPTNVTILETRPHGFTASFTPGSATQTPNWFYYYSTDPNATNFSWNSWIDSTTFVVDRPDGNYAIEPETTYYLWILYYCEEENTLVWGDPVSFTTPEACPAPTNLTITNVTPHGVEATFTPGGDWQNQWGYYYTTTNVPPPYFNSITIVPSAIYPEWLHALQPNTHYYLWVGIECEEGGTSTYVWGEPAEFTTPYACSTKVYAQDVEIDDVQTHEVSLDWGDSPATADQWQVCYSYYDIIPPESSMSENSVIVDEPYATIDGLFPDLDYHFWIRALCDYLDGTPEWGEWSDMITVHTEVSCFPPVNVTVSNITSTTATISWNPNPNTTIPAEYYEVNIESDDWGDPYVAHVTQPYFELDLDGWVDEGEDLPCTVYVHAYCGQGEGLSEASETVGFILTDKEQLTVNDGTATNEYVPVYGYYCDEYSQGQFIIPAEDIEDMQFSEISWMTFYASNDNVNWGDAEFEVYLMELPCETEFANATLYDWYDMELVRSEGSLEIRDGQMVVDLEEPFFYTDGNLLIGFRQTVSGSYEHSYWYGVNTNGNTALGGYEDSKGIGFQQFLPKVNFVYEPTTSAVCSKPKNLTVGRVNATTIECGWTPGGDETLWEVAWGYENFDPDDNTTWISHSVAPYNPCWIFDFTPDMTYTFAVRAVCNEGQGVYSNWTCPVSFTLQTCPTPTNVTITDITTNEATVNWEDIGDTWITLYRGNYEMSTGFETQTLEGWTSESSVGNAAWTVGVGDYQTSPGPHSGSYNAKITHTTNGNETWLISPMMDLTNVDVAYLDFWYINRIWGDDVDELGVYYRIDEGDWNLLFLTAEAHGTWTNERIDLALLATNDNCQVGFKMTDNYGYGVGLDDIVISGYKFAGSYVAYSPAQSFTLTNLNPNTTYTFYMRPNCDGEEGSSTAWMYFTTADLPTQTIALAEGWNWVSFNVETTLADLKAAINAVAQAGDRPIIKSQSNGQVKKNANNNNWMGQLTSLDMSQMYKIQIGSDCEIVLQGQPVDPAEHPATIVNGANWIAYPLSESMSVAEAFSGFDATNGDNIKSQRDGQTNKRGNGWMGQLQTLVPGNGYIYNSKATATKTLVFPSSASKSTKQVNSDSTSEEGTKSTY